MSPLNPQWSDHFRKALAALLSALLVLTSQTPWAMAQEAEKPSGGASEGSFEPGQIVPLAKGDGAPFEGLLIEQDDLVRWRLYIERLEFRRGRELELWEARQRIERELSQQKIDLHLQASAAREELWETRAKELGKQVTEARQEAIDAAERSWYESPILWFSLGVLITGGAVVGAVVVTK